LSLDGKNPCHFNGYIVFWQQRSAIYSSFILLSGYPVSGSQSLLQTSRIGGGNVPAQLDFRAPFAKADYLIYDRPL
jgi:hypothetical protein